MDLNHKYRRISNIPMLNELRILAAGSPLFWQKMDGAGVVQ